MTSIEDDNQLEKQILDELLGENGAGEVKHLLQETPALKVIKDALVQCTAQNRAILEGHKDMVLTFDQNLTVVSASSSVKKFCSSPIGKHCKEMFRCRPDQCLHCAVKLVFQDKYPPKRTQEINTRNKEGGKLVFEISCSPVRVNPDKINKVVVIARDVTDRLNMEQQLRQAYKMEAVGTLAGGIAHDFNNLLTPIMGYSEIIRMQMQDADLNKEDIVEFVDEIITAAKRSKKLVEQILIFSRSGEQKESLQYIHPIVKEVLKLIRNTLPSTIKIAQDIDEGCGMVYIDPVQIHQIVINLCVNAADAIGRQQGELLVSLKKHEQQADETDWLVLSVSDNGCGIDSELKKRIFEPYFTTKEKEQGTGMGLAMLHGIVKRHGGEIEVESEVGSGTTFSIFLPVTYEATSLDQVVNIANLKGGHERILLVDDEEQVVEVAQRILESLGYNVTAKTSAHETLLLFTKHPSDFDLIITDQTMPYMMGTELCKKAKEIRPDIPVILFTGYIDESSNPEEIFPGVDGYCIKPISFKEMADSVRQVIDDMP